MPTIIVQCVNIQCSYQDDKREVGLQHLGQGVYILGELYCQCGWALKRISIQVR